MAAFLVVIFRAVVLMPTSIKQGKEQRLRQKVAEQKTCKQENRIHI